MAISGRKHSAAIGRNRETPTGRYQTDKEQLEDHIMTEEGIQATVNIYDDRVTIKVLNAQGMSDYPLFLLAKRAIKGRVSQPIFEA